MNIGIIGVGYVGLVSSVCFASLGNTVYSIDIDEKKIDDLRNGIIPIYEEGLSELLENNKKRIKFTTSLSSIIDNIDILFCAVGTPMSENGSADLRYVISVAEDFARSINKYTIFVTKSTVPVGTHDVIKETIDSTFKELNKNVEYDIVSNPEFLREGSAINDFLFPDRIVIGCNSDRSKSLMTELYKDYIDKLFITDLSTSEMIKYASNSMLATRISFMNELSNLCDKVGANIEDVSYGMGTDKRIGNKFLNAGCGYGGSCFPKDVRALIYSGKENGVDLSILKKVDESNTNQKMILIDKFKEYFKSYFLDDICVCIWGLSFKPNTDDIREATSLSMVNWLKDNVRCVNLYDPIVKDIPIKSDNITFYDNKYDALDGVDCLFIVTEWDEFKNVDFELIKMNMNNICIIDGRNIYSLDEMVDKGFDYISIGRKKINKNF